METWATGDCFRGRISQFGRVLDKAHGTLTVCVNRSQLPGEPLTVQTPVPQVMGYITLGNPSRKGQEDRQIAKSGKDSAVSQRSAANRSAEESRIPPL